MKIDWLFEDHTAKWLDFNLIKNAMKSDDFEDCIPYSKPYIDKLLKESYAENVKLATRETFLYHCTNSFKKNIEIAFNPLLLNIDYVTDLFDIENRAFVAKHLAKHNIDLKQFCTMYPELKILSELSKIFLKLNRLKCNLLNCYFDTYFFDIDNDGFMILNCFSMLNTNGRNLFINALKEILFQNIDNMDAPRSKLDSFNQMIFWSKNPRNLKTLFKKEKLNFIHNLKDELSQKTEATKRHSNEYKNRCFSKELILGEMLLKLTAPQSTLPAYEIKIFAERIERFASMDTHDLELLKALNSISTNCRRNILNSIAQMSDDEQYLRRKFYLLDENKKHSPIF